MVYFTHTHTQKIILQLKIHYVEIGISSDSLWTVCPIETDQHSLREDGGQFDEGITASRCFSCQAGLRKQRAFTELTARYIQQQLVPGNSINHLGTVSGLSNRSLRLSPELFIDKLVIIPFAGIYFSDK